MPSTSQQLVTLACQTARCPGYVSQVGQFLNQILSDLCETYDFELARGTSDGYFNAGATTTVSGQLIFGGPNPLPSDYLRAAGDRALTYWISGVSYQPRRIDIDQFDQMVQQAGNQNYPSLWTADLALADEVAGVPSFYLYCPPSGNYGYQLRYFRQMPDITTPETSAVVPWFPNQGYLQTKLTAMAMGLSKDTRQASYEAAAEDRLEKYLKMKDDPEGRTKRVKLDRRFYGPGNFDNLKTTKKTGW